MSDEIDFSQNKEYASSLSKITTFLLLLFLGIAGYTIFDNVAYFEQSAIIILGGFFVSCLIFFIAMKKEIISLILLSIVLVITCLILLSNSFDWRRSYIENGFILEAYIQEYPNYIDYLRASFEGSENIVDFANDCLGTKKEPVQKGKLPKTCTSVETIKSHYNVDIIKMIIDYHAKMQRTATSIADGKIAQIRYPSCINTKRCVYIPLLPTGLTEEEIENSTDPKITTIRDGFWELVDGDVITTNTCNNMFLCKTISDYGLLTNSALEKIKSLQSKKKRRKRKR